MAEHRIQVAQQGETLLRIERRGAFIYRYAYARSADTRAASEVGQDYLTFRCNDGTFVFALCDGVGQSFYGDLAARFLGEALVEWLWNHLPTQAEAQALQEMFVAHLQALTTPATALVQAQSLPPDAPPIFREVLEHKRALGSESTFVCGRIDLPGQTFTEGRLVFAWMGDSRLRFWGPSGERTRELGDTFHTAERWSSRRGLIGEVHLFITALESQGGRTVQSVMVYSDGLAALDRFSYPPSNAIVQDLIVRAGQAATSDDLSFLQVWLKPTFAQSRKVCFAGGGV